MLFVLKNSFVLPVNIFLLFLFLQVKQFETEHDALRRAIAEKEEENRKIEEESARQRKEQEEENARQKWQHEQDMLETIMEQERRNIRLMKEQETKSMDQEEENRKLRRELDKNQKQGITPKEALSAATSAVDLVTKVVETAKVIIGEN